MSAVGQREYQTQQQVLRVFQYELDYRYLGDWKDRAGNRNIEEDLLRDWLSRKGFDERVINRTLRELDKAAAISGSKTLYDANRAVYEKLRYGVHVKPSVQEQTVTVWLIDWANPDNNDFAVAEEVTVAGENTKRPDVVLYVNGIALGILELKRSTVPVAEGIRQSLDNQKRAFIQSFFATVQLVMAGNPTEGLRYGVVGTPEKFWMEWKEPSEIDDPLARGLHQLCSKERLLEIVHDFMVFDAGIKK
ncbi:MAG: type I restriction endonuclease, partial [Anaerolineae bacterium]